MLFWYYFLIKLYINTWNIVRKRVQTDTNGYVWVRTGALVRRGYKQHKNRASRGHLWCRRSGFGTYGRGNFPGHHVLGCLSKNGLGECRWVQRGSDGRGWMYWQGGKQKQGKKSPRWVSGTFFCMHVHGKKIQQVIKDGLCAQRGSRGGINGETRGALYNAMYKSKLKARK